MSLPDLVAEVFAPQGVLARGLPGFLPRPGQTEMALAVAQTLEAGGPLVVEAGTGVGKTYAYLVPLLLSGKRALVSTATKTLQDQLFDRDLPRLRDLLGLPLRVALLKGRSSYLCVQRLAFARQDEPDTQGASVLARIERWAVATRSGDLAELPGLDDNSPWIPRITSTRDNCLGTACPKWAECHVNAARRQAMAADLVVINHHLFFADLAVRESGVAELLPTVEALVFDEAHQLNETGVQFLGQQFSSTQWLDFARDVLAQGQAHAPGLADWNGLVAGLTHSWQQPRDLLSAQAPATLRWMDEVPEGLDAAAWRSALLAMREALRSTHAALALLAQTSPDLARLAERAEGLGQHLLAFMRAAEPGSVRWAEAGLGMRWVHSPLDMAATLPPLLAQGNQSWVFTSATLGDEPSLRWFTQATGLEAARCLQVPSPFDYAEQAALWVPEHLPEPDQASHSPAVAALVRQLADALGGRVLVLTTTLKAMRQIAQALNQALAQPPEHVHAHVHAHAAAQRPAAWTVLLQGQSPKRVLLERFAKASQQGVGCVLVASVSFWEGVDIAGDALQCVVIDKLPFPPPGDPLVQARLAQCQAQGQSPFMAYTLPAAAIALKQGAGRLIRSEQDRGLLVLADARLHRKAYGKRLLAALPPMRRLHSLEDALAALQSLAVTRTATTPSAWPSDL